MLAEPWQNHRAHYDVVVVGSGYGGSVAAARLASLQGVSVCLLERGREWPIGEFPDTLPKVMVNVRTPIRPLGLYELLNYADISVIDGCGLGGTSLINANVALVPDREVFASVGWPASIGYDALSSYFERAAKKLGIGQHPRASSLYKVRALNKRAAELGKRAEPLNLAVNFDKEFTDDFGIPHRPCIDCGDCTTGCNHGAKNTLYMNYLPAAKRAGASIFTQAEVQWIEHRGGYDWAIHGLHHGGGPFAKSEKFTITAAHVVLAAGSIHTTEILLRSEQRGLRLSRALGTQFSGNGDFLGFAYNTDHQTDVLGYGVRRSPGAGDARPPGPTIVAAVRYGADEPLKARMIVEDVSFPSACIGLAKETFILLGGEDTAKSNEHRQRVRRLLDVAGMVLRPYSRRGALNHTMMYLCLVHDNAEGFIRLGRDGHARVEWKGVGRQRVFARINDELRQHANSLGGTYLANPSWSVFRARHLLTGHPIGGCPISDDYHQGVADPFGCVYRDDGATYKGLTLCDGSLIHPALGVNPLLTITAVAEHICDAKVQELSTGEYPARR
jgi:cholesterol oxidase